MLVLSSLMIDSPFPHHGPLEPAQVHGRDDLIESLTERVTGHRPTVVVAPRRYGKTSLLARVEADLAHTVTVVHVDLYEIRSWADLATRLDAALAAVPGTRGSQLGRLAASFDVNLGVIKATLASPGEPDPPATVDRLADILVRYATANPTVAVFDEFSSIARVDGAAGLLRTKLQHHFQRIGLLFAGSEPSTMHMLFESPDQPFYAQADLVQVPPLSLLAFNDIVSAGFDGDPPPQLAGRIHNFTSGHPQRSMQLADAAWLLTDTSDGDRWPEALARTRETTDPSHEIRFSSESPADQAVLRLVARRSGLFGREAARLGLSRSSAQNSRNNLVASGQVVDRAGQLDVVDPLYADWVRRRFSS